MTRRFSAVHQFHSGTATGDAVTQHMLTLRAQLRGMGYESHVFAQHIASDLHEEIRDIASFRGGDGELLLVHHSIGHTAFERLLKLESPIVTVFHSITPAHFFDDSSWRYYVRLGVQQLRLLAKRSICGIAVSNHNRKEMYDAGFGSVTVMPVRTDFSAPRSARSNRRSDANDWLFVGRVAPNKCQLDVVRAFAAYNRCFDTSSRLTLVGDVSLEEYVDEVMQEARRLGVLSQVTLTGKVSNAELLDHYARAALFVCMSQHEGFGVPLLEAMAAGLPVIARSDAAVPETMGGAGILVANSEPWTIAGLAHVVSTDQLLRDRLIAKQDERLERIERFDPVAALTTVIDEVQQGQRPLRVQVQGPFETSYSLATLNRELAEGLTEDPRFEVSIYATEGPGDYRPKEENLVRHPVAAALHDASRAVQYPDVVVRQMYPPRVDDSPGGLTFQYFGWEESRVPDEYVRDFNRHLDGIGVMSHFVERVLRDSGVVVPIRVVGVGVVAPRSVADCHIPELVALHGFRFLHNSSAFPRKGVDLLLEAYFAAFSGDDDVSLILKTYPNPHNEVGSLLDQLRATHASPPDVRWIDRDLDRSDVDALYGLASSYVHPARGEGFGLPVAEAMLAGVPIISVAATGLAEFVSDETATIVPFTVQAAATHLSVPGSEWVEPDVQALQAAMVSAFKGDDVDARQERVQKARDLISAEFSWHSVCARWSDFLSQQYERRRGIKVAMVTTWNSMCGIADYSASLVAALGRQVDVEPYGDKGVVPTDALAEETVFRAWDHGLDRKVDSLLSSLSVSTADIVHVQYNWGFFPLAELGRLVDRESTNRPVVVTLHRTADLDLNGETLSLRSITSSLQDAAAVIVHQPSDVRTLADLHIVDNVRCIPIGCADIALHDRDDVRRANGVDLSTFLVGTFGFLLPHKGTLELIRAIRLLRDEGVDTRLMAVCATHPHPSSAAYRLECAKEIRQLGIQDFVTLTTEYVADERAVELLSMTDLIALPYAPTAESSSAALRFVLPIGRPLLVSDIPIFDDARDALEHVPAPVTPQSLASAIRRLIDDPERRSRRAEACRQFAREHSWSAVGQSTLALYQHVTESCGERGRGQERDARFTDG